MPRSSRRKGVNVEITASSSSVGMGQASSTLVAQASSTLPTAPITQSHSESFPLNRLPLEIRERIWEFSFAISAHSRPAERHQGTQSANSQWGREAEKWQTMAYGHVTLPPINNAKNKNPTVTWLAEGPAAEGTQPTVCSRRAPSSATACREAYSTFRRFYRQQSKSSTGLLCLNQGYEQHRAAVIINELVDADITQGLSLLPILPPREMNLPVVLDIPPQDHRRFEHKYYHESLYQYLGDLIVLDEDDPNHPLGNSRVLNLILSTEDVYDRIKIKLNPTATGYVRFMIPTPKKRWPRQNSDSEVSDSDSEPPLPPLFEIAKSWVEKCDDGKTSVLVSVNEVSVWRELAEIASYYGLPWPFAEKLAKGTKSDRQAVADEALRPLYKAWAREKEKRETEGGETNLEEMPSLDVVVSVQVAMEGSIKFLYGRGVADEKRCMDTAYSWMCYGI